MSQKNPPFPHGRYKGLLKRKEKNSKFCNMRLNFAISSITEKEKNYYIET